MSMTLKTTKNMCCGLSVVFKITTRRSTIDVRKKSDLSRKNRTTGSPGHVRKISDQPRPGQWRPVTCHKLTNICDIFAEMLHKCFNQLKSAVLHTWPRVWKLWQFWKLHFSPQHTFFGVFDYICTSSGRGPTRLRARVRNRGRLENRSHMVQKKGFQDGGDQTRIFSYKIIILA